VRTKAALTVWDLMFSRRWVSIWRPRGMCHCVGSNPSTKLHVFTSPSTPARYIPDTSHQSLTDIVVPTTIADNSATWYSTPAEFLNELLQGYRSTNNIATCSPVARQWPRNKQLYNDRYQAAAPEQQQMNGIYSALRVEMLYAGQVSE
jgi:hypothetical protein